MSKLSHRLHACHHRALSLHGWPINLGRGCQQRKLRGCRLPHRIRFFDLLLDSQEGERIVGLGRIPAVVDVVASRPQIQERLTDEIADALEAGLDPRGVLVVVEAAHGCVAARGARQARSTTVTVASRGQLAAPIERAEIMALIGERR